MAYYRPDYTLRKALKLLEALENGENFNTADEFESVNIKELIIYLVSKKESTIKEQRSKIKEYQEFFETMDKFLPKNNVIRG